MGCAFSAEPNGFVLFKGWVGLDKNVLVWDNLVLIEVWESVRIAIGMRLGVGFVFI